MTRVREDTVYLKQHKGQRDSLMGKVLALPTADLGSSPSSKLYAQLDVAHFLPPKTEKVTTACTV